MIELEALNRNRAVKISDEFKILSTLAVLNDFGKFRKELNVISWHDEEPVFDIRNWNRSHSTHTIGVSLTENEMSALVNAIMKGVK